jgi:uncharacterized protein with PIN domain
VRSWDSSAIVPLIVDEAQTDYCLGVLSQDQEMTVWCLIVVEALTALCRRFRDGAMRHQDFSNAKVRLNTIMERTYQATSQSSESSLRSDRSLEQPGAPLR